MRSMFKKGQEVSVKWGQKYYDGIIEKKIGQGYDVYFTADNSIGFVQNPKFIQVRETESTPVDTSANSVTTKRGARNASLDPPELSEYERQRLANIAKNQEYMVKLGLKRVVSDMAEAEQVEKRARRSRALYRAKAKSSADAPQLRRSNRNSGKDPEYSKEQVDAFFPGLQDDHNKRLKRQAKQTKQRQSKKSVLRIELTEAQRVNLGKFDVNLRKADVKI